MDALKIIPQVFFDLIGRILPGVVAILLLAWREPSAWAFFSNSLHDVADAPGLPWWLLLALSYVVGHLLSPGTKLVQKITSRYPRTRNEAEENDWLLRWIHVDDKKVSKAKKPDSKKYDWLRVHSPDVGGIAAKLRAEFTMYNTLSVILFLACIASASHRQVLAASSFLALGVLMAGRGYETEGTMRECVEHFFKSAGGREDQL